MSHLTDAVMAGDKSVIGHLVLIAVAVAEGGNGAAAMNDLALALRQRALALGARSLSEIPATTELMVADIANS